MRNVALLLIGLLAPALAVAAPAPTEPAPPARRTPLTVDGVRDTGQFLPNETVLARVGDRTIRAGDFVSSYFASDPEFRSRPDSLGRREFLESLVDKDALGLYASLRPAPFDFEDRATLRAFRERTLANIVYQRLVNDSVRVTSDEVREVYEQTAYEQRFRRLSFSERTTAEKSRADLLAGRASWGSAGAAGTTNARTPEDLGWVPRASLAPDVALTLYALRPGQTSEVLSDRRGYYLVQAVERRAVAAPDLNAIRGLLRAQLRDVRAGRRAEVIQAALRQRCHLVYDTAAVAAVAVRFQGFAPMKGSGGEIEVSDAIPEFSGADTARVLARWDGGRYTLRELLHAYTSMTPLLRPALATAEAVMSQIDGVVLEPYMAAYAVELGFDRDPFVVAQIQKREEALRVHRMFRDSIESKVSVTPADRRRYFEQHAAEYRTIPTVRFARLIRPSQASATALAAALTAGASAIDSVVQDSLRGVAGSARLEQSSDQHGPLHRILFEELKPGQNTLMGPDSKGSYMVLHVLESVPSRPYAYAEVEEVVDESLRNIQSEARLKALIRRARARYHIETHPELVQRVRLVDPTPE